VNRPLGCLTGSALIALIVTLVGVSVAAAVSGNNIFSPGGLNASRAQQAVGGVQSHADLARRCGACHAPFWSADRMGDRCLACHTEVNAELSDPHALHFGIANASTCRNCHTEHHGPQGALTLADMSGFPHDRMGFSLKAHPMRDAGGTFLCSDCHGTSVRAFQVSTCADCHQGLDAAFMARHTAAFGTNCLACHDGLITYGKSFNHNLVAFHLEGAHAEVDCAGCHAGAGTLATLRAAPQECVACHQAQDIHQGRLGQDCGGCHKPTSWKDAALQDHSVTGFALVGSHIAVQCQACHTGEASPRRAPAATPRTTRTAASSCRIAAPVTCRRAGATSPSTTLPRPSRSSEHTCLPPAIHATPAGNS
jgi:hypothetical protein